MKDWNSNTSMQNTILLMHVCGINIFTSGKKSGVHALLQSKIMSAMVWHTLWHVEEWQVTLILCPFPYIHTHMHMHACTHTHMHARTHTHTHSCMHACMLAHTRALYIQWYSEPVWGVLFIHQCYWVLQDRGHCRCVPGSEGTPHPKARQCDYCGKYEKPAYSLHPTRRIFALPCCLWAFITVTSMSSCSTVASPTECLSYLA